MLTAAVIFPLTGCFVHRLPVTGDATEITIAKKGRQCDFSLLCVDSDSAEHLPDVKRIEKAFKDKYGVDIPVMSKNGNISAKYEIVVGIRSTSADRRLARELADNEYAIKARYDEATGGVSIIIAYRNRGARMAAVYRFVNEILTENEAVIPIDLDIRGTYSASEFIHETSISLRDPCVLVTAEAYYVYGTNWKCYKNTGDLLTGEWVSVPNVVTVPEDVDTNKWAPEVHYYNGAYYMFTTYKSKTTGHRGCVIFKSESPEGPFVEISGSTVTVEAEGGGTKDVRIGHISPADWDAIDGTLYVDPEGQPWMVFVHEYTSTEGTGGRMSAVRLSEDFTTTVGEAVDIFNANETGWSNGVTDGCYMYTTEDGQLLMIWSSFGNGYCVAIARSVSGNVLGPWTHGEQKLFSADITGGYDGGHGMIFTDRDGQMYLSFHSPNGSTEERKTLFCLLPIREEFSTLTWDMAYEDVINNIE